MACLPLSTLLHFQMLFLSPKECTCLVPMLSVHRNSLEHLYISGPGHQLSTEKFTRMSDSRYILKIIGDYSLQWLNITKLNIL